MLVRDRFLTKMYRIQRHRDTGWNTKCQPLLENSIMNATFTKSHDIPNFLFDSNNFSSKTSSTASWSKLMAGDFVICVQRKQNIITISSVLLHKNLRTYAEVSVRATR